MDAPELEDDNDHDENVFSGFESSTPTDRSDSVQQSPSSSAPLEGKNFYLRRYQMEVFRVAVKRSTIAVMETGSGKTMIAVMLIKHIGLAINSTDPKKLIIFLAPTVHLVHQQYEVIKSHTNFRVGEYFGAKGVDEWSVNCWEKEIHDHDVLVMTPQILLDALRKAFLCLEAVSLLIFDECHHATGNHPYAKIMKEFYHKSDDKPKIFGMTASPVVRKGVSSTINCESQISELEIILDSQIYTIEDKKEMELHIPFAKENCIFYEKEGFQCQDLKDKIEALWSKDSAFDLRRWVAPGQHTLHPMLCKCGVDLLKWLWITSSYQKIQRSYLEKPVIRVTDGWFLKP